MKRCDQYERMCTNHLEIVEHLDGLDGLPDWNCLQIDLFFVPGGPFSRPLD